MPMREPAGHTKIVTVRRLLCASDGLQVVFAARKIRFSSFMPHCTGTCTSISINNTPPHPTLRYPAKRNENETMKLLNPLTFALFSLSARTVLGGGGTAASDGTTAADAKAGSLRRGLGNCDVYEPDIGCQCLNGIYCGQNEDSTGIDANKFEPNTLYDCEYGCYTVRKKCDDDEICSFEPCKHDDICKAAPAPPTPTVKPTPSPTESPTASPSASPSVSDHDCDNKKNIGRKCIVSSATPIVGGETGVCVKEGGFPNDASDKKDDRCCPTSAGYTVCSKSSGSKGATDCCNDSEMCDVHSGDCVPKTP